MNKHEKLMLNIVVVTLFLTAISDIIDLISK